MKTRPNSKQKKKKKKSFTMKLNNNTECKVYSYKLVKHQCMSVAFSVLKNENENEFSSSADFPKAAFKRVSYWVTLFALRTKSVSVDDHNC